jgi:thiamine-phosphate pyrophosphorylase
MEEGADYIAFGPVFETKSKDSEYEQRGLSQLREIAEELSPHPVVAIGGITRDNLADILAAGAKGAAVISAVAQAKHPRQAVGALAVIFDSVSESP